MFLLRTSTMPSLAKLLELERLVAVDNSGSDQPVSAGLARACQVGEFLQGSFLPKVVLSPGDLKDIYVGDPTRMGRLSQAGINPASHAQDGSGVTWDGNGWAELKGKTINGLVITRVDCDMCTADSAVTKAFVKFNITVAAADQSSGVTNKDIIIPSGTRFADAAIGSATKIIATSQRVVIPTGTAVVANTITCGVNFVQDVASGVLTFSTAPTIGVTCFFVKGTTVSIAEIDTVIDPALPDFDPAGTFIAATSISTVAVAGTASAAVATAGGGAAPTADTLANRIYACYSRAIDLTLPGTDATNDIVAIWSARNWSFTTTDAGKTLRRKLWQNAIDSSRTGRGRVACVTAAPSLGTDATSAATAKGVYTVQAATTDTVTGVDGDRYWLGGPFVQVFSSELNADIMISSCGFRAAMKVNLANDGRSEYLSSVGTPYNDSIQNIDAQEPAFAANPLLEADYVAMKAARVAWLTKDRKAGWWFYSGVTGADPLLYSSRIDDNRRSFADEIQDVIFGIAAKYAKLPGTTDRQDAFSSDMKVYLDSLVNPPVGDARARAYLVTEGADAGNTDTLNGQGVFLFGVQVQMNGSMKTIVINTAIGPNVVITQVA
jgi:hypothetical protein